MSIATQTIPSIQRKSIEPTPRQARHELRMEPRIGASDMKSLLEHDAANTPSPLERVLEHGRTEHRRANTDARGRCFAQRSGRECRSGLPLKWHRQEAKD